MKIKRITSKKFVIPAVACILVIFGLLWYFFLSSFTSSDKTNYVYIDNDDDIDSVFVKLQPYSTSHGMTGYTTLVRHSSYPEHVKTGRYAVEPGLSTLNLFRHMKNGIQTPFNLTVPSVRTMDRMAKVVTDKLLMDSTALAQALTDQATCQRLGFDTTTVAALFIPNTYDIYWNVSVDKFLDRMKKEHDRFWNDERQQKAKAVGLTPVEVATLASIIDEETANDGEKPMIAGMYLNRLRDGMPLQADPTVKFALKDFALKRIYNSMLSVNSPYNTYRNAGLPPGPIRVASVAGLDAVLNPVKHDYLYMCAKEDFSGTHNFARTYQEHLQNAARYSKALNERGIK